ncbi:transcription termination factor MTERF8, chloroplastic-like [Pistacia vera]|uniref:transcription termination factor MTERF8, chloroplastic-like n=1 Tax=Pistacia vera TaxID=55513 RepID=UPI0012637384|nr:transcription termination factor MTERF8, chloroplastic-like [Pistacia vera]
MFCLCRKILQFQLIPNWGNTASSTIHLSFRLQNTSLFSKSFSSVEVVAHDRKKQPKQHSFTVSYFINSCGLSPEIAASLSKKVAFETPENPDSVLGLFRKYGFTDAQISKLIKKRPEVLVSSVEETLLPKLEFFHSVGISCTDLGNVLCSNPFFWRSSLEKQIIPNYNFLKSLVSNNEKIVDVWKRAIHLHDAQKRVVPNISALKGIGVTQSGISALVTSHPSVLCERSEKFDEYVKKVIEMGFNPSTSAFIHALTAVTSMSNNTWEQKLKVYRSWGWSEIDFWLAFRSIPRCMTLSVENINSKMDFFVNKMGWQPSEVARTPVALSYSLEKRIIPRCRVLRVLLLNDLIKKNFSMSYVLQTSEKLFTVNFLSKYQEQVPQLFDIYQGKFDLSELGIGFEQKPEANQL